MSSWADFCTWNLPGWRLDANRARYPIDLRRAECSSLKETMIIQPIGLFNPDDQKILSACSQWHPAPTQTNHMHHAACSLCWLPFSPTCSLGVRPHPNTCSKLLSQRTCWNGHQIDIALVKLNIPLKNCRTMSFCVDMFQQLARDRASQHP